MDGEEDLLWLRRAGSLGANRPRGQTAVRRGGYTPQFRCLVAACGRMTWDEKPFCGLHVLRNRAACRTAAAVRRFGRALARSASGGRVTRSLRLELLAELDEPRSLDDLSSRMRWPYAAVVAVAGRLLADQTATLWHGELRRVRFEN